MSPPAMKRGGGGGSTMTYGRTPPYRADTRPRALHPEEATALLLDKVFLQAHMNATVVRYCTGNDNGNDNIGLSFIINPCKLDMALN